MRSNLIKTCINIARDNINKHPCVDMRQKFLHFSFIVSGSSILGHGVNMPDHPNMVLKARIAKFFREEHQSYHAEIAAYYKAERLINGKRFDVLNIRVNRHGILRMAKPCSCCFAMLKELGARNFYYSSDVGFLRTN